MTTDVHPTLPKLTGLALLFSALAATACTAVIEGPNDAQPGGDAHPDGVNEPAGAVDPGRKGPHRLSNREYNNTIAHLLGTTLTPARTFLSEIDHGFDNIANSLGMTAPQYEGYFNAATTVADDVFADPGLREAYVTCQPATPGDSACAASIIEQFGLRAFRRPLSAEELSTFLNLYNRALELNEDHDGAMKYVLRGFLSSAEFLYRIEFDPNPGTEETHLVSPYEMASRLSYFQWGSMPDEELLGLAQSGELSDPGVLAGQIDRMLADPKSRDFVKSFAGQWLGMHKLSEHAVIAEVFPTFDEPLRAAMNEEAYQFFATFLYQDGPWNEFLTADFNFVDARLAEHYGLPAPAVDFAGINVLEDQRRGFLGLGMFLTMSSYAHRTSVPLRAKWVLENLLCDPPPDPPPGLDIGSLDGDEANQAAALINVRDRLELHRTDPNCGRCHSVLDPIGFGLEQFDAIGEFRDVYGNGDAIDATGTMPDGTTFSGLMEMSEVLSRDPRFMECTVERMFNYALGRGAGASDQPYIAQILKAWTNDVPSLRNLMKYIVVNDTFRLRRGELSQ